VLDRPGYFYDVFNLYGLWKQGIMPEEGGYYEQPSKLMAMFAVIGAAVDAAREQKAEADKTRAEAAARAAGAAGRRR